MANTIQLSINVINEMKKLRTTTYSDRTSWIEELIQNTQRAKAKNVRITVKPDKFIIEDNGIGCSDPNTIFEKNISGWGSEISSQNPFGEGFFSTIIIANRITVRSIGFEATFDVGKMFRENTLDCITVKKSSRRNGFVVELTDLESEYNTQLVKDKIRQVVKYISDIKFYLNGERLKHKKFTDTDTKLAHVVNNDLFTGWIAPFKWGYADDGYNGDKCEIYAQGRYVKDLNYNGIRGILQAKDNALDLRSPDRKDIIQNDKLTIFKDNLLNDIKRMFINVLKNCGDDDINKYASCISRYLNVDEYQHLLRFVYLNDYENVNKILSAMEKNSSVKFDDVAKEIENELESQEVIEKLELRDNYNSNTNTNTNIVSTPIEETKIEPVREGRKLKKNNGKFIPFYVNKDEIHEYLKQISLAEYYGIDVILVRNSLEEEVLVSKDYKHIKNLNEEVKLSANLTKVGAIDEKESRAMFLFEIISKGLGFNRNIFKIGNMTTFKNIRVSDMEIVQEEVSASFLALAQGSNIYIDRDSLKNSNLVPSDSKEILNSDRLFIVNNLKVIAHELAHAMFYTTDNTKEHAEAQLDITERILQGLF